MKYTQANCPLAITTPLGPDALLLERIQGTEAVSELFHYEVELLAEAPVPFDKLLGQPASVTIKLANASGRRIHGIITRLTKGGRVMHKGVGSLLRYRAEPAPAASLLTRRVQSRVFQQQTVPQILQNVLQGEWQLEVVNRLTATYPQRNFCVQYRESDWAFVSRLMEDEGIAYYFQHDAQGHRLVLADHPSAFAELPQHATVDYVETEGGIAAAPTIRDWEQTQVLGTYRYSLRDYHFQKPQDDLTAHRAAAGTVAIGTVAHSLDLQRTIAGQPMLAVDDWPGELAQHHDGVSKDGGDQPDGLTGLHDSLERRARLRLEEESAAQLRVRGGGDCGHFAPGHRFQLARHIDGSTPPGDDDRYLLTRVELTASQVGVFTGETEVRPTFENRFECLPVKLPFRPRRVTPRPTVAGPETAVVVGPKGEDIHCDKFGRVKVQFHWEPAAATGDSSCWVRVAQPWAGQTWGALTLPRVGQEVVVGFVGGDPDRPLIQGSLYNAEHMPPYQLPDERRQSGFVSSSGKGADQYHELRFDDTEGQELLHVHSQKDMDLQSENDHRVQVGNDHAMVVGNNHTVTVAGDYYLHVGGSGGQGSGNGQLQGPGSTLVQGSGSGGANWELQVAPTKVGNYSATVEGSNNSVVLGHSSSVVLGNSTAIIGGTYEQWRLAQFVFNNFVFTFNLGVFTTMAYSATTELVFGTKNSIHGATETNATVLQKNAYLDKVKAWVNAADFGASVKEAIASQVNNILQQDLVVSLDNKFAEMEATVGMIHNSQVDTRNAVITTAKQLSNLGTAIDTHVGTCFTSVAALQKDTAAMRQQLGPIITE